MQMEAEAAPRTVAASRTGRSGSAATKMQMQAMTAMARRAQPVIHPTLLYNVGLLEGVWSLTGELGSGLSKTQKV
ncbi:MAG: hypothetical protein LBS68_00860 [Puniceicoccales bacterium]|nr:hypothetical protein [Puniceicoccales bacterium]